jgi:hypothetical protein
LDSHVDFTFVDTIFVRFESQHYDECLYFHSIQVKKDWNSRDAKRTDTVAVRFGQWERHWRISRRLFHARKS